jgi:hydroxyacylglutathione hydrolase
MILESFPTGPLQSNCTLVADEQTKEALVIDPGDEANRIHKKLTDQGLTLKQILLTHGHLDHVGGAFALKQLTGAPIFMHEDDQEQLDHLQQQAGWLGMRPPEIAPLDGKLEHGQKVGLENYPAEVIHTPGHTQGSVCFLFGAQNLLVAGDTLFAQGVGRTDLPGGDYGKLMNSIHSRLLTLPDEIRVITGHGPDTTIGRERRGNPYI